MKNENIIATEPKKIREFIKSGNFLRSLSGILIGGTAGFLYYHFVGCSTGSCPITSHSYTMILFGGLLGYLIISGSYTKC